MPNAEEDEESDYSEIIDKSKSSPSTKYLMRIQSKKIKLLQ
jgi:hypothetical protein